jgi:hypothetical protein
VPPAVALSNYISSGILCADFLSNWDFRGVFSIYIIINNAVRISEAAMGGGGDIILIKMNKTKIRTYGRTGIYMNIDPKWIKKGLAPLKNPLQ